MYKRYNLKKKKKTGFTEINEKNTLSSEEVKKGNFLWNGNALKNNGEKIKNSKKTKVNEGKESAFSIFRIRCTKAARFPSEIQENIKALHEHRSAHCYFLCVLEAARGYGNVS